MPQAELLRTLAASPLVASVQASEGSPVDSPEILLALAKASMNQGVRLLRLQGLPNISTIKNATGLPTIGLIKQPYTDSPVYITPTKGEVKTLLDLGCEVIALDGTDRDRPNGETLSALIAEIHDRGALAMADCDCMGSARYSIACGADVVGTTLAGYTDARSRSDGPDLDLLREVVRLGVPVIAEGRYSARWHVDAALRIGAIAVVVGGALNDPVKQTRALMPLVSSARANIGAIDIGGTWLRFGNFDSEWHMIDSERTLNPPQREARLAWIREMAAKYAVGALGIGTGGIVDPKTGICGAAKEYLMPDHIGIEFSERTLGLPTKAHGDGHATAWGHACHPRFAGRRVASIALGTGVGCGFVENGRIWAGRHGEYPRLNDLPTSTGKTFEDVLGGLNLSSSPSQEQRTAALEAFEEAVFAIRNLYFPDVIVVAGSVGLSDWMKPELARMEVEASPFGTDAGLFGAAALALYPPCGE